MIFNIYLLYVYSIPNYLYEVKVLGRRYVRKHDSKLKMNYEIDCNNYNLKEDIFNCPWPEYNVRFEEDYENDEIDLSWLEFDVSEYELFPIEIHYANMNKFFNTVETLSMVLEYLDIDRDVMMVNKLFYLEGKRIKFERFHKNLIQFCYGLMDRLEMNSREEIIEMFKPTL